MSIILHLNTVIFILTLHFHTNSGFWDFGTTTASPHREPVRTRLSFFEWPEAYGERWIFYLFNWNWSKDNFELQRLNCLAGISIDFVPLSVATILNRRVLITSANYLDPHMNREKDIRVWTLGRAGRHVTPVRYRVWRIWRLLPRSLNREHQHGPRGSHVPRHDVAVIITLDKMYIYGSFSGKFHYPHKATLTNKHDPLDTYLWFGGTGFQYLKDIYDNYRMNTGIANKSDIVDCSKYLPKFWGKFICIKNLMSYRGLQNGMPLFSTKNQILVGIGCFEIRYNEDRIMVFTDLRYYVDLIYKVANITPGQYYEYAYPHWSITLGMFKDDFYNRPYIPTWQISYDLYPLG